MYLYRSIKIIRQWNKYSSNNTTKIKYEITVMIQRFLNILTSTLLLFSLYFFVGWSVTNFRHNIRKTIIQCSTHLTQQMNQGSLGHAYRISMINNYFIQNFFMFLTTAMKSFEKHLIWLANFGKMHQRISFPMFTTS